MKLAFFSLLKQIQLDLLLFLRQTLNVRVTPPVASSSLMPPALVFVLVLPHSDPWGVFQ